MLKHAITMPEDATGGCAAGSTNLYQLKTKIEAKNIDSREKTAVSIYIF
jgi:hypothetical protein